LCGEHAVCPLETNQQSYTSDIRSPAGRRPRIFFCVCKWTFFEVDPEIALGAKTVCNALQASINTNLEGNTHKRLQDLRINGNLQLVET